MNITDINLTQQQLHTLLSARDPDAALVYLYLRCGNHPQQLEQELGLGEARRGRALATLRQLGLWQEAVPRVLLSQEPPQYTEQDVMSAMSGTQDFPLLVGEVQRVMGRILTTEELKILLACRNYLGLPMEVINLLVCHCKERLRRRGNPRNPSLRAIEKEAFHWAEKGIDTLDEAVAYIQAQDLRQSQLASLMKLLQISGRSLTPAEERYAQRWLELGFDREAYQMAYEKTCLNTGGLKWAYMDKILASWHSKGLHTGAQILSGDRGAPTPTTSAARTAQQQTQRVQAGSAGLSELQREAIARMLREHPQEQNHTEEG